MNGQFEPEWFSAPGQTLQRLMIRKQLEPEVLAKHLNEEKAFVLRLLSGTEAIDTETASQLSEIVGGTPSFWTNRQAKFEDSLSRIAQEIPKESQKTWVRQLPLREMQRSGWVSKHSSQLHAAMAFFDVSSPEEWREHYATFATQFSYRTSDSFESKIGALTSWLRQAELQAANLNCEPWNPRIFKSQLSQIRGLTKYKDPSIFISRLQNMCKQAGVAVVFVRAPSGCRASGATKFLNDRKAMIVLSFRHLSDDHFWFSFFHEAGHILLHGATDTFVDGGAAEETEKEKEANAFAAGQLVPLEEVDRMLGLRTTARNVIRFAVSIGITPGIVVGQLQHHGVIGRNQLNSLKRRFTWEQIQAAIS